MKKLMCMTELQLIKKINAAGKEAGSLAAWAVANGVQPSAPSAFVRRTQPAGKQLPAAFGLVPITVFVEKGNENYFEYPRRNVVAPPPAPEPKKKGKKKGKK